MRMFNSMKARWFVWDCKKCGARAVAVSPKNKMCKKCQPAAK